MVSSTRRTTTASRGYARLQATLFDRMIAPVTVRVLAALVDEIAAQTPRRGSVLDVGCGGGQLLAELATRRPDLRLVGVEPSALLAARARRRLGPRADILEQPVERLPADGTCFDVVVSAFAVKHWADPERAIRICADYTGIAGTLVVTEIDAWASVDRWRAFVNETDMPRALREAYVRRGAGSIAERAIRPDRLRDLMRHTGRPTVDIIRDPQRAVVIARAS
jgi:SAM-dependent methyltransferase